MKKLLLFFMTFFSLLGYAQFPEGFESTTFLNNASPPALDWWVFTNDIVPTGVATNNWQKSNVQFRGTFSARIRQRTGITNETASLQWLVSPQVAKPVNGQIRFYTRKGQSDDQSGEYTVRYSLTSQTDPNTFITLDTWNESQISSTAWEQKFVPIPATVATGQNIYIAFVKKNVAGDTWYVDDIKVDSQCLTPTNLQATPLATSAMLSWNSPNPAGPWEIEYGPTGFTPGATPSQGTIIQVTTNPRNLTGLSALTSYDFYVRTMCDVDNPSPWSIVRSFTTTALPPECDGNFVDPGGATGDYTNSFNNFASPVVICPTTAGEIVTVTFTSFNTETNWDALYVYDGPDTNSPLISSGNGAGNVPGGLAGGYWGTTIPGPFTSTHPSGCLTFVFRSDSSGIRSGWTSNVTCAPPPNYCAGDHFYDLGGPTGNYPNNLPSTRGYTKICPNAGQSVTVFFNSFDVANDTFSIYDGDNLATALLVGTYSGTNIIPSYTASNPTGNGCLIFVFTSNSSINAAGWDASIVCGPPCQAITSSIASSTPAPAADTVIKVCQDQVISLNGAATFGTSGTGATYNWNFGDNTTAVGQNVTHSYPNPGIYSINLYTVDQSGCRSINRLNQLVYVSTDPSFTGTGAADDEICLGQSTTITGVVTPTTFNRVCAPPVSGTTFLPDGTGVSYQTQVPVDCFALGSTLTSASQITSVCLNMEHSWLGDLNIQLISPSGQSIILKAYNGTGGGGAGTYLGCPNDDPSTVPGTGRTYCFTPTATTYLVNGATSACGNPNDDSIVAGNYMPVQPFTNLIGSTLNGNWTIVVTDNLALDNGYIFDWSINFDSSLINTDYSFTPSIVSSYWSPNPSIVSILGQTITVTPTVLGTNCYTYNVVDSFGCTYSHEVCIETTPGVSMTTNTASPLSVFAGQNGTFNFSGGTPFAVVTYNINSGANQTVTLNAAGTAVVNVTALTVDTTLTVTGIAEQLIPTTGNVIAATGGVNPIRSTGPISPPGAAANTGNCTTVSNTNTASARLDLRLADELPIGTVITISIAKNTNAGSVNITDGTNTITFNTAPTNNVLQRITFTMGRLTDLITITRNNGIVYVDGITYTFDKPGCDAPLNLPATIDVVTPPYPFITSVSNAAICSGADAVFNIVGSANTTVTYSIDGGASQTVLLNAAGTGTITVPNPTNNVVLLISQIQLGTDIDTNSLTRTITVNPKPLISNVTPNPSICSGTAFSVTPTDGSGNIVPSGTTYTWATPISNPVGAITGGTAQATGLATISQTLTNTTSSPATLEYTITPNFGACVGSVFTITVDVNPKPFISNVTPNPSICSGTAFSVTPTNGSVDIVPSGTTYTWTVSSNTNITGASASSATGISAISQTLTNISNTVQTITYTVTPTSGATGNCVGTDFTITVVVNPKPLISNVTPNPSICSGTAFSVTPTNGSVDIVPSGTTYTWTVSSNTNITGASASSATGISAISQTLTNISNTVQTITYTVTPTSGATGNCVGTDFTITVDVNPKPLISNVTPNPSICSGTAFSVTPTDGSGNIVPSGTTYTWAISSNTNITGASASSATGISAISQTLTNISNTAQTITYTVTPTSGATGNCVGTDFTITVDVNPKPLIANVTPNPSICSGTAFSVTPTNGSVDIVPSGTTYTWTVSSNTNITGASASSATGISAISQTLTNISNTVQTITYTVTPTSGATGNCVGTDFTITVVVNPKPLISNVTPNPSICSGTAFSVTPTDGSGNIVPSGTTYTWATPISNPVGAITGGTAQATGIATISQTLTNTTSSPATLEYTITPNFGACVGSVFTITVDVNPKPFISNVTPNPSICSGTAFSVTPTNGSVDIVPSGTTYTWTVSSNTNITGASASSATGISAISQTLTNISNTVQTITYTVTPTSGATGNCVGTDFTITVVVNPKPFISNVTPNPSICSGTAFSVTPTDGSGNIVPSGTTYTWATPISNPVGAITGGTAQATGLATISQTLTNTTSSPATLEYTITPNFGACVGSVFTITVDVNPKPFISNVTPNPSICSGTAFSVTPTNGSVDIVPSGTTYTWTVSSNTNITGASASSATGISAISQTLTNISNTVQTITYTVTPTSGATGNCVGTDFTITVVVNPKPLISNVTPNPSICSGTAFSVTPTDGSGNIVPSGTTYTWATPISNPVGAITGGTAQATGIATISQTLTNTTSSPATLEYTITPNFGACVGSVFTITVDVNPKPFISNVTPNPSICSGTAFSVTPTNGSVDIVPSGTTYTWTVSSNTNITGASASSATGISAISQTLTNISNTVQTITYTVTPTSGATGNCVGTDFTITVVVNPKPLISNVTPNPSICSGTAFSVTPTDGSGNIVPSGTTYTWAISSNTNITGASASSATGISAISQTLTNISNTAQTITYTVTPTSGATGNCVGTDFTITVDVNPKPLIANVTPNPSICSGTAFSVTPTNGSVDIVPSGTTYTWTVSSNTNITGASASSATGISAISQTLTNISNTVQTITYTVTPTSGATGNCVGTDFTITVVVNPKPLISNVTPNPSICSGTAFSVTPTDGSGNIVPSGTTYTWTVSSNTNITGASASSATGISAISQTLTNISNTVQTITYTVTPTSGATGNCVGTDFTITVVVNPKPLISNVTPNPSICSGTAFSVTPTDGSGNIVPSGTTYTWATPISNPVGAITGGTAQATGIATISQTLTNTTSSPATLEYTITPNFGACVGSVFTITVDVNPKPFISNVTPNPSICSGTAFSVTPTNGSVDIVPSGTTYTWTVSSNTNITGASASSATGISAISQTLTNISNTVQTITYTVTPTSGATGNCVGTDFTITVEVSPTPTLILSSAVTTTNQTICVNSPIVPIQYTFDAGATSVTVTGLPAGISPTINGNVVTISGTPTTTAAIFNYTVTATGSLCGTPSLSGVIEVTTGILPIFTQVNPVCQGATINIPTSSNNTPPIVGVWNLISSTANDVTYEFTPNAGQCGLNTTMTIVVHPLPTVIPSVTTQSFCSGGTTNINLVPDVAGSVFYWTATGTSVTGQSGSIIGSGATSINQTLTLNANQVAAGQVTYSIVAEANGCLGAPVTVVVTVNPIPNVIVSPGPTDTICSGGTTNISFSGAINNTVYSWSVVSSVGVSGALNGSGAAINQTLITTGLSQGTVVYEVTPSLNGCTGTPETITVTVNPVPAILGSATHPDLCSGQVPTNITVSTFNAATVFNWVVDPVGVSGASAGTATGSFINIVQTLTTTGNVRGYVDYIITPVLTGCSGNTITVRVYVNPLPVVSLTKGTICVDSAGVPFQTYVLDSGLNDVDYDFVWTFDDGTIPAAIIPGANSATYTATAVGTYTVVATNSTTNCVSNIASAVVTATNPATSLTVTQSEYFSDNATLVVTVTGGNGTLLYQLDQGALQESNVFTGVTGGTHIITVVDTQGCTYLTQKLLVIDYPKYFTPNGDGHNDTWNIIGMDQSDAILYIYDRYGKLVKQIVPSILSDGWDGTFNNIPLPSTDYWFTLDYTENGAQKQFKAHFSLKR